MWYIEIFRGGSWQFWAGFFASPAQGEEAYHSAQQSWGQARWIQVF